MNLKGIVRRRSNSLYVLYRANRTFEHWVLVRDYHIEDEDAYFNGGSMKYPILTEYNLTKSINKGYIVSALKRSKIKGTIEYFGNPNEIMAILSEVRSYREYRFNKNNILVDESDVEFIQKVRSSAVDNVVKEDNKIGTGFFGDIDLPVQDEEYRAVTKKRFEAIADNLTVRYTVEDGNYSSLYISSIDFSIDLKEDSFVLPKLPMTLLEESYDRQQINGLSMPVIDYPMLEAKMGGLPWYKDENGNCLKDYKCITNQEDFEWIVIKGIVEEYERCMETGEEFIIAMDTETTGLNICSLPEGNPLKDYMVSIPLSWKDNQGVVVFVDMAFFPNVDVKYAVNRLKKFFELPKTGEEKFICKTPCKLNDDGTMEYRDVEIDRNKINLTGHNTLFDGTVWYDKGVYVYFNNDTMQIAFNMDPELSRGQKGLKLITRKLFNANTPDLEDVAGKGNEDKYRYISNEEVAVIYGCADGDFSRLCYKELKKICPPEMMRNYRIQDMPIIYSLIPAQYYGMNTDLEAVKADGALCKANIETIQDLIYRYVGMQIDVINKVEDLTMLFRSGVIDEEGYEYRLRQIKPDENARYEFKIGGKEARDVIYNKLNYPVTKVSEKSGAPALDKKAMDRLKQFKKTPEEMEHDMFKLTSDIPNLLDDEQGNNPLVKASEFNKYKYPLAYLLDVYSTWNKEYTAYYKPILADGMNGRLYKTFSTTRIETRRIANPGQTMKGSLKKLIRAHDEDWYLCDWDMSQVEYRIMISQAGFEQMIELMRDPEKDFHTETASLVHGIPAHQVPKDLRKKTKPISFGIPYGLGERKMCENIFHEVNDDLLYETRRLLMRFKRANKPVIDYLEHVRDEALIPREFPNGFKKFMGISEESKLGWVKNDLGFWRLFKLDDIDNRAVASIRRKAGNYPIQSFAAELFRKALINFKMRTIEEGLDDKIIWHMLIHDELLFSVHKSVHPYKIFKMLQEECMVQIQGHTNYYIGINIGENWEDCKNDKSEAPIYFVRECVKRYESGEFDNFEWMDDAKSYVMADKMEYVKRRVHQILKELYPNVDSEDFVIDMRDYMERCTNYTVRSYVNELFKPHYKVSKGSDFNHVYLSYFETYLLEEFGEGRKIIDLEGNLKTVMYNDSESTTTQATTLTGITLGDLYDLDFVEDDDFDFEESKGTSDYWSFDSTDDPEAMVYGFMMDYYTDEDVKTEETLLERAGYNESLLDKGVSITEAVNDKDRPMKYVKKYPKYILIKAKKQDDLKVIKRVLRKHLSPDESKGLQVLVELLGERAKYPKLIRTDVDLLSIDEELVSVLGDPSEHSSELIIKDSLTNIRETPNGIIIKLERRRDIAKVKEMLSSLVSKEGKLVTFSCPGHRETWLPVYIGDKLYNLDSELDKLNKAMVK